MACRRKKNGLFYDSKKGRVMEHHTIGIEHRFKTKNKHTNEQY